MGGVMNKQIYCRSLPWRALAIATLLIFTISCNNIPGVDITILEPIESGNVTVQRLAPDTIGGSDRWRISVRLRIDNNSGSTLQLQEIEINNELASNFAGNIVINDGDSFTFQNCNCDTSYPVYADSMPPLISVRATFQGLDPVTVVAAAAEHVNDGGPLAWPGHEDDLNGNEVWGATSNHPADHQIFALDTSVMTWDTTINNWNYLYPNVDADEPESSRSYGKPIYALSSGTVCWALNDHEEWETLSQYQQYLDGTLPPWDIKISPSFGGLNGGGNQLFVKSGDEIWLAAHMQPGSIPPELLIQGAPVAKGRYIGKVGYAGTTSGPHVHIHVKKERAAGAPVTNNANMNFCDAGWFRTMQFNNMQSVNRDEARTIINDPQDDLVQADWKQWTNHSVPDAYSALYPSASAYVLNENFEDAQPYIGVFRAGNQIDLRVKLPGWAAFTQRWEELSEDGFRLKEVETLWENDQRYYIGLYERGSGGYALIGVTGWNALVTEWQNQSANNMRLIDVDAYYENGDTHYIAVFESGTDGYALYGHSNWTDFANRWVNSSRAGLRLVDVDVITVGGAQQYVSVYRAGNDGYGMWSHTGWDAFVNNWVTESGAGLRLIDVETFLNNDGSRQYLSTYRAGNDGYALYSFANYERFLVEVERLSVLGIKLVDVVVEQ
jgi:hypothetical protein